MPSTFASAASEREREREREIDVETQTVWGQHAVGKTSRYHHQMRDETLIGCSIDVDPKRFNIT
eukprot:16430603-Heterocapsa_arctica.AAC.1